jgi:hypothetical protein
MIARTRRTVLAGLFGYVAMALCQGATAQTTAPQVVRSSVTVLELFTSQGCSSCPAADLLFKSYVDRADLLALSYSVDYWDYLGWKDTLASPKFTARQRAYGKTLGNGQVYTPQMVINGVRHAVGSSRADIDRMVAAARNAAVPQASLLVASRVGDAITIAGIADAAITQVDGAIWLVTVRSQDTIIVKRGENGGRTLTYHNVVRDIVQVGRWSGAATSFRVPTGGVVLGPSDRFALLIQPAGSGLGPGDVQGPVLAAGWVK